MTKKYSYVTTAIPYVNGEPHIGHAIDYLLADVWARYHRQLGETVRFQTGVDEHGNKIAAKAASLNLTPQEYVDGSFTKFVEMIQSLNISNTDFIRTTNDNHKKIVQYIWKKLDAAGLIYKGSYDGWYCQGCEAFVTDKDVADTGGICPDHKTKYQQLAEENYYFKASVFTEKIIHAIETGKMKIIPESRKREFLELIKGGLQDVSISRPLSGLSWGIPVPDDDSQVMYVWLDALSNYISVLHYPTDAYKDFWPADVQVVGKDILRFHAGIWPAMLLGLELPLPKVLLVHGHITSKGTKISKSLNNGIDPMEIIKNYGIDATRYYFLRYIPTQDDGDFTWERFEAVYNGELANDLGNLVQRVAAMIVKYQAGVVGDLPPKKHDMAPYRDAMETFNFNQALDEVWILVRSLNQYIDRVKPWEVAKNRQTNADATNHLAEILSTASGTLVQIADLLAPFLPETSDSIKATFQAPAIPEDYKSLFPKIYIHTTDGNDKTN